MPNIQNIQKLIDFICITNSTNDNKAYIFYKIYKIGFVFITTNSNNNKVW